MGTLVAMRYPTKLFANLADHTYVKCATGGASWPCWGGNTGGTELRRADGSTARANAIANPDGKAGIKCYLINGVCHQAANRILLPAGITVVGARGYHVSEALFGAYGRPSGPLGTCQSPFDQHPTVSGDLPMCVEGSMLRESTKTGKSVSKKAAKGDVSSVSSAGAKYLKGVLKLYADAGWPVTTGSTLRDDSRLTAATGYRHISESAVENFEAALFNHKLDFQLGGRLARRRKAHLEHVRRSTGRSIMTLHRWFSEGGMPLADYLNAFDHETFLFQQQLANLLVPADYKALFDLEPGDFVLLVDRSIAEEALGKL